MINRFTPVPPRDILSVGGFLGQRFDANRTARLKDQLLSEEFTVENNMFTPTMKVRRKNVMEVYNDLIESMYP